MRGGASCDAPNAQARGLEVRLVRRLPAVAARLRGRAARARRRARDRLLPRGGRASGSRAATTSRSSRARSPPPHDAERIREIRARSRRLITHRRVRHRRRHPGAAQLRRRRGLRVGRLRQPAVHLHAGRPRRRSPTTSRSTSSSSGCPIDKRQLLEVISAYLNERSPQIAAHSVCIECKRRGNVCVMVAHGTPCLGPGDARGLRRALPDATTAAATAASGRWRRPTPARSAAWLAAPRRARRRDLVRAVPHLQRRRAEPFRAESEADAMAASRDDHHRRRSPASRARARWTCACATAQVAGRQAAHLRAAALLRGASCAAARFTEVARHHRAHLRHLPGRLPDERVRGDGGRLRRRGRAGQVRALRRLLYCGEWIESHALHVFMLHAPDFLGYASAFEMAARPPRRRRAGAALKKAGNELMRVVGGREIHPINVRVGGFYRAPDPRRAGAAGRSSSSAAREFALEAVALDRGARRSPTSSEDYEFVALRAPGRVPDRARPARLEQRPRHRAARVRRALRRGARRALDRAALARCATRGAYLVGPAGALRAQPRPALAARRARRRDAAGLGAGLPQPVPQHRRARASRSSTRSTRRCGSSTPTSRRTAPAVEVTPRAGVGLRLDRGAARHALAPLRASTTTARSSTRRSCRRRRRTRRAIEADLHGFVEQPRSSCDDDELRPALRAGDPQLRPVHLLRDALPDARGRPRP